MGNLLDALKVSGHITVVKNGEIICDQENHITGVGRDWIIKRIVGGFYRPSRRLESDGTYTYFNRHTTAKPNFPTRPGEHGEVDGDLGGRRQGSGGFQKWHNLDLVVLGTGTTSPSDDDVWVESEATWNSRLYAYTSQRGGVNLTFTNYHKSMDIFHRPTGYFQQSTKNPRDVRGYFSWTSAGKCGAHVGNSDILDRAISSTAQVLQVSDFLDNYDKGLYGPYTDGFWNPYNDPWEDPYGSGREPGFHNKALTPNDGIHGNYAEKSSNPIFGQMPHYYLRSRDGTKEEIVKILQWEYGTGNSYCVVLRGQKDTTALSFTTEDNAYLEPYPNDTADLVHKFRYSWNYPNAGSTPDNNEPITEAALCFAYAYNDAPLYTFDYDRYGWTEKAFSRVVFNEPWNREAGDDITIYWTISLT